MAKEYQEFDIGELFKEMKRFWWLLIIMMLLSGLTTYLVSDYLITPLYQAEITLFIGSEENSLGISLSDLNRNNQLIEDYRNIAESRLIINSVLTGLNLDIPISEFRDNMSITVVDDSRLFIVGYKHKDPNTAKLISNELGKQLSVAVVEIVGVKNIRVIDMAILPLKPLSPNIPKNTVFGSLTGLVLALISILIIFLNDDKVSDKSFLEDVIAAPVIGSIPMYVDKHLDTKKMLYMKDLPHHYISECYKMLRSNIAYVTEKNDSKVIMFTSSAASEGKTTTITNLAIAFANEGKKVLVVDADLRRPQVHNRFGLRQTPGLTNLLYSKHALDRIIKPVPNVNNLHVITSGSIPPTPDLILGSSGFETLIVNAKEKFDYILIDVTPTLIVSDAVILARLADEVIFVVAMNETKKTNVELSKDALKKVGINFSGIVTTKEKQGNVNKKYGYYLREEDFR